MKRIFVAGIGTDVGKTVVSAIVCESLGADYWKPIQAGNMDFTDTDTVKSLVSNTCIKFHKEAYLLKTPASPHLAAEIDNTFINIENITVPQTSNSLIIEGAGGLMVPLNNNKLLIECLSNLEVILVSSNYLGSINHTLLSIELLKNRNINIKGIVFNGTENKSTEEYILNYSKLKLIGKVKQETEINKKVIKEYAKVFFSNLID